MAAFQELNQLAQELTGESVSLPEITIKKGALDLISDYLRAQDMKNIVIVADEHTKSADGNHLYEKLEHMVMVQLEQDDNGQVIADEQTIVQLLAEVPVETDVLLAVGAGTIHDIVRFVGYKMNIPFISVPTAASVDGFTSKGAPLIFKGMKKTIQTAAPIAVFADLNVLMHAPKELTASGFGDILGKYTSLTDWKISQLVANEPYSELAAAITRQSLEACVTHVDSIGAGNEKGIRILTQALIESGMVMLVLDHSRPASGGEHHLSHYWEMELLKTNARQLLHGTKVGVSTAIITALYKENVRHYKREDISIEKLRENWEEVQQLIESLPNPERIRQLLTGAGGPSTAEELGLPGALITDSLNEAHHLRDRCTGLYIFNQLKNEQLTSLDLYRDKHQEAYKWLYR
ncbi:sn-glycerol-1-phosphate dehydrogenase [Thalassobacillus sp. CUG 92003]|uniref:sn-glycerol-1-phosphate dehydrogenase n=1 Tax=Thalassobacillus sp. CUG 92003 TaxID=2736641 RepID=UPI0015E7B6B7|nr:sn-glycerol-1-phosphate dehydrogenase [Thalassobacillus sp. CUG 92003]